MSREWGGDKGEGQACMRRPGVGEVVDPSIYTSQMKICQGKREGVGPTNPPSHTTHHQDGGGGDGASPPTYGVSRVFQGFQVRPGRVFKHQYLLIGWNGVTESQRCIEPNSSCWDRHPSFKLEKEKCFSVAICRVKGRQLKGEKMLEEETERLAQAENPGNHLGGLFWGGGARARG